MTDPSEVHPLFIESIHEQHCRLQNSITINISSCKNSCPMLLNDTWSHFSFYNLIYEYHKQAPIAAIPSYGMILEWAPDQTLTLLCIEGIAALGTGLQDYSPTNYIKYKTITKVLLLHNEYSLIIASSQEDT